MESGPFHSKDDSSTFVSIPLVQNQTELTPVEEKHGNDTENNKGDATITLSGYSISNQIENCIQYDIQDDQDDISYPTTTKSGSQSNEYSSYENHAFVPSDQEEKHYTSNETVSFHENQDYNQPTISNLAVRPEINSDKMIDNENEDPLRCESILSVEKYEDCDNCDNKGNKTNILSLNPKYLKDFNKETFSNTADICDNISDCKVKTPQKGFKLRKNSYSNTGELLRNNEGERISKESCSEISIHMDDIITLSEERRNVNDQIIDAPITPMRKVSPPYNPLSRIVSFVTQESQTGSILTLQGNNRSPIRRLSKRRLSQWGMRKNSNPRAKTYVRIVEGVNEKKLWSEARSLNRPALFVLWWSALAMCTYIASFYDLWADCSVTHLFYTKYKEGRPKSKELVWFIMSIIILVNSYIIQCCFSFYEVTHGGRKNFGRLAKKKFSIPLFLLMPWIIVFIGIYDTYKNKYTWRLETAYIMMFIEVIFESLPQTSLQLNAIIVYAHEGEDVSVLQWCSVSSSILFLSMGIAYSVIFYNNENATQKIKALFCVFGGITVVSRILLCSSWALRSRYLWMLPSFTGLLTTALTWLSLRTFSCFGYKEYLTKYEIKSIPMALVTSSSFLTSYIFNCFSPSGLPVSVLMYALALVDFQLELKGSQNFDYTLHVVNICLTIFILMCNIVFSFVPKCHILSQTWIEGEGEDEDDPYHFRFY